jgi:hypothetical protein
MRKPREKIATVLQILEYMDGPQVVLLERTSDAKIIGVAIDQRKEFKYPFFGAEISQDQWERYKRGFVDLRFLFMFPRWKEWYIFDFAQYDNKVVSLWPAEKDQFAEEHFVPDHGFFGYDHSEPVDVEDRSKLATQKYTTDGIWDLPDFSQFYNKITDLYSFFLSLQKFESSATRLDLKKKIKEAFIGHPMRGGFSYVNLYDGLSSIQELEDRLSVGKLQYASPGEVNVRGRLDIFDEMSLALNQFAERYDALKEEYHELHSYLSKGKLLKTDNERFDTDGPVAKYLLEQCTVFAKNMSLSQQALKLTYNLTDKNSLTLAKILLSHYRRLERYFMFFAEGRVKEPQTIPPAT